MDKRRYVAKQPRRPRSPASIEADETGNPALDGYTVRHRQPLKRDNFSMRQDSRYGEHYAAGSLLDETEVRMREIFGDE